MSQRLSALFVGDSFTVGAGVAGAANGYACILARSQGWACNVDAFGATGYLNDGAGFYPTPPGRALDRLSADVKLYAVDMVVLDSGRNDLGKDPAAVVDAFTQTLAEVQQLWPSARVVVIMPAYMSATPYTNYSLVHTGFVAACGAAHATLLDPVAEQWYSGVDIEGMQIPDHVHPNALGNQFLAGKIADSMARHGLGDLVGARVPS
ncbi:SGNH/GDSL hydrolase family protein [Nocardia sp.]|uniref:SGNH/GDSL hydrolase family protein n=1 Tax=Nocardia sp. TaxID=1821 RepID=UPI00263A26C4|nr:SGNH/GDSL hydrolase family protein [Nocardia sp.]